MVTTNLTAEVKVPSEGEFRFDVDCGLLFQLGEELVSRRSLALAELIKNAYDADATHVIVTFRNVSSPGGEIMVLDNGTGIPFTRIIDTWMRIATTEKERHPASELYRRQRAGAKGIGRFAARNLSGAGASPRWARIARTTPGSWHSLRFRG